MTPASTSMHRIAHRCAVQFTRLEHALFLLSVAWDHGVRGRTPRFTPVSDATTAHVMLRMLQTSALTGAAVAFLFLVAVPLLALPVLQALARVCAPLMPHLANDPQLGFKPTLGDYVLVIGVALALVSMPLALVALFLQSIGAF